MRILVTGCEGFVGYNVTRYFQQCEIAEVIPVHHSHCFSSRPPRYGVNLLDADNTDSVIKNFAPDVVVHLAGKVGGIGANRQNPAQFMYDNLVMGINLLEAAHKQAVERVVMVGTVCSYPLRPKTIPFVEEELWDGYPEPTNAPYGIAKRTLIELALQYNKQYCMSNVCLLPVNMYGEHDNFDLSTGHVIPSLIRKMHQAKILNQPSIDVWGTGNATREFMYVRDFAEACWNAATVHRDINVPINIGTGKEVSIAELLQTIAHAVGFDGRFDFNPSKPDGQPRRTLDIKLAEELLRWKPYTELNDGIDYTYQWYLENVHENTHI